MYCKYIFHQGLSTIQYKTFFHMCRLEGISFDLERREGASFILPDCLQSSVLGILTVSDSRFDTCSKMMKAIDFLQS